MKICGKGGHKIGRFVRQDIYYRAAKKEGFAARSVFKIEEIDQSFGLIKKDSVVLDLGCAPGSWLQYVSKKISMGNGFAIGIDLSPVTLTFGANVKIIQGDIYETPTANLRHENRDIDVLISDMAPNTTGIKSLDQDRSMALCERALEIASEVLRPGGNFCVKVLEGGGMQQFVAQCRLLFSTVKIRRPKGTRVGSMETYVVGLGKKT